MDQLNSADILFVTYYTMFTVGFMYLKPGNCGWSSWEKNGEGKVRDGDEIELNEILFHPYSSSSLLPSHSL